MKRLALLILLLVLIPVTTQAAPSDCNAIVSMSQGRQVYVAAQQADPTASPLEASTGEQWMLLFAPGKTLGYFTQAANWNLLQERHRCGTDAEIDSIVFIFDPRQSSSDNGSQMIARLGQVEAIVAARYPNAVFYPTMLVGADGHVDCVGNGRTASSTHADRIDQLESSTFTVGPDLDVPCSSYADPLGHLTNAGAADANSQVGEWFNGLTTPGRVVPETIPYLEPRETQGFTIMLNANNPSRALWRAYYFYDTFYADNTGWLPGDRVAYSCAYMFLQHNGEIVGRVTFRAIPPPPHTDSYIVVNDKFMNEGERYYEGSPTPPGTVQVPKGDCPFVTQSYATELVPDERPKIVYWQGNNALEVRDYAGIVPFSPGVTFDVTEVITEPFQITSPVTGQTHTVNQRISVLERENGVPGVIVYYDSLGSGEVSSH